MAKLIYSAITSLDGYIEDAEGTFGWAAPDTEVFAFVNELERPIGIYLYGRRMYETMVYWETVETAGQPQAFVDYAQIWRAADKLVFSRTLSSVTSARTRIEAGFDPDAIRAFKRSAGLDLSVGGAELAGQALRANLIDECHLFLSPVLVGGGKRALPTQAHGRLELLAERRFKSGVVHLHYQVNV